jgi:hypothetical protein
MDKLLRGQCDLETCYQAIDAIGTLPLDEI